MPRTEIPKLIAGARFRAVVVGGEPSFVVDKYVPHLREMGISMTKHWPWRTVRFGWPEKGIDLVIVVTDMMDHKMYRSAVQQAQSLGVPVVLTVHKWSIAKPRLERTLSRMGNPRRG